ncbi:MAG: PAS domain-containing sensor histidine kinase [Alphaproteobacteria bacterium]|nr:PAS domain-containing sensor histidine kinase [Alphaproteobacteria bacterium]
MMRPNLKLAAMLGRGKSPWIALAFAIAAVLSAMFTYTAITSSTDTFGPDPRKVTGLILINLTFLLGLAVVIIQRVIRLWAEIRSGVEGSRLQRRVVTMFSLVTIIPTILVAAFSVFFFNFGIQSWFNARVSAALENSVAVAQGYLAEHKEAIRADALEVAGRLNREIFGVHDKAVLEGLLSQLVDIRGLSEGVIFQRNRVVARSTLSFSLSFEKMPFDAIERAGTGEVVILTSDDDDRVRALVRLDGMVDTYLLVGRYVDSKVLEYTTTTRGAVAEYMRLKSEISMLQIRFSFIYLALAMILLSASVWAGMAFARVVVAPLAGLIAASERLRAGDYSVRVGEGPKGDEIAALARAFNRMAGQLEMQRRDLVEAHRQADGRRRFIETVLSGVSAGVIALDDEERITLLNRSAAQLLRLDEAEVAGVALEDILPEMKPSVAEAKTKGTAQATIALMRNGRALSFRLRVEADKGMNDGVAGFVLTFDDITELLAAQRNTAWSDVARRIAHEIKNPLTPIQLSAERLKKKYAEAIQGEEKETFIRYIDTIGRHVRDIGRIVEEFASFARMPAPVLAWEEIGELVRKAVFSETVARPEVAITCTVPQEAIGLYCDARQMRQVLGNILKNAAEALEGVSDPKIDVILALNEQALTLTVTDNGKGFPAELMGRLTEPYVTGKAKGTGLGLAIVRKIVEDHNGLIVFENIQSEAVSGARVSITFPVSLVRTDSDALDSTTPL